MSAASTAHNFHLTGARATPRRFGRAFEAAGRPSAWELWRRDRGLHAKTVAAYHPDGFEVDIRLAPDESANNQASSAVRKGMVATGPTCRRPDPDKAPRKRALDRANNPSFCARASKGCNVDRRRELDFSSDKVGRQNARELAVNDRGYRGWESASRCGHRRDRHDEHAERNDSLQFPVSFTCAALDGLA